MNMSKAKIVNIERVQSLKLWDFFQLEKTRLKEAKGKAPKVKTLYHGTGEADPSLIYNSEEGFDLRYSRAGNYGVALCFANESAYSHDYRSTLQDGTTFQMF